MKELLFLFIVACCMLSFGCGNEPAKGKSVSTNDQHTSANSLDWHGVYKGVLPCADCQGIETELTINNDNTYLLKTKYLGKDSMWLEDKGSFAWNKEGNKITLDNTKDQARQYWVGENGVTQLDMSGNKISGGLAENYVLAKQLSTMDAEKKSDAGLVETYWKLTELMGKPVAAPAQGKKEIHIILKTQDNRIQGFAGCNSIMGSYELKEGNGIRFKEVASTRMACDEMSMEDQFKEILERADNYSILEDKLSLNKARMAPMARFEAVYH